MNHSEFDHGLGLSGADFVVAVQPTRVGKPSEGTLNDPTLGQYDELSSRCV